MKNLTFKSAMLNDSRTTVNRQSTDGQSQRHCKQTPLSKRWKVLMTLVFLFTFSIGNVWAATSTDPATVTFAGKTFLNVAATDANARIKDSDSTLAYNAKYLQTQNFDWVEKVSDGGSSSTSSTSGLADAGFLTHGSNNTGDSNNSAEYSALTKIRSDRPMAYYVTGITSVGMVAKGAGTSSNKWIGIQVEEVTYPENTLTLTSVATAVNNKNYTSSCAITLVNTFETGKSISGDKYYKITVIGGSENNMSLWQVRFGKYIAPATKHHVTYSLGGDYGTTPTQADVAEGAKFNLHNGTTGITPPTGKQFGGWNDGTTTYAGGAEYTMGTDDVELTAVWETAKTNPTATFSAGAYVVGAAALDLSGLWSSNSDGAVTYALKEASDDASVTAGAFSATKAGSYVVTASQAATSTYNAIEKEATITVTWPATGAATVIYEVAVGTSQASLATANMDDNSASISNLVGFTANNIATRTGNGKAKSSPKLETPASKVQNKYVSVTFDVAEGKEFVLDSVVTQIVAVSSDKTIEVVVVAGETKDSLNYSQVTNSDPGNSHQFNFSANAKAYTGTVTVKIYAYGADANDYRIGKPLKVCGKVQNAKVVKTTDYALTDVKVNGTSISAANLATLKTASAYKVDLADQFAAAPTIKFNKETTITYTDDSQKVTDEEISVDATIVDGKWQAQAEIGGITYTVTAVKVTSFTVNYFDEDGTTSLGSEVVSVTGHPNASEITVPTKSFKTFADWKLSGTVVDLNNVSAGAGETVTLVASYTPAYAQSINIEQWVLDNSKNNTAFRAVLDARHYEYANLNDVDSLRADKNDGDRNEPYLGQKWKLATSEISFLLKSGSTVHVKFGNVGSDVNIKLGDNDPFPKTAAQLESPYEYTATEDVIVRLQGTGTGTVVVKQIMIDDAIATVKLHAVVTYDAGAGTFGKANEKYTGTPLVIADATPAEDYTFAGWFLGEDQINAAAYEPAKDITLVAKYVVKPSPFSLTALTYTIGAGEAQNVGYVEGTYTYTVELPYAGSYENITVAATLKEAGSSIVEGAVMTVTSLPGAATFTVSDGAEGTQLYTINFKKGAKDGVEIIGVVTTGGTNKTVSGLYKGDASVDLDGDKKIASGKSIYVTLASGYTFEETDVLVVDVAAKSDLPNDPALEITTGVGNISGSVWKSIANADYELHLVTIPLTGIAANQTSIGLKRSDHQNTWVNGLKVYRPMMPKLTAITINGEACVKGEGNTFSITLPEEGTNLASLEVVPTIIRNAAHATTPEAVITNEGAWKAGDNTYRVMDKDGDYTDYTITITLQGQAPAPFIATQPAGVTYCAGSEPTLTVEATGGELHYAWFKEAGETDEAVGTDAASYTAEAAGTYYVIVTNHVDGKLDASVTSENAVVTLNVAAAITKQPTNKRDIALNSEVTLSVEATNATGYQWYSCEDAEKHGAAAISGAEAANYVFNCSANAFYYCVVGNACGDDITSDVVSVKLEPEGCNTFASKPAASPYNYTQAGEWTFYFVDSNGADKSTDNVFEDGKNFDDEDVVVANTRRFALKFEKDVESVTLYGVGGNDKSFEKVSVSDEMKKNTYTELTATATKTDLTSQQHIFTIEDMIIPAGKYAWFELSGSLKFFKICYTAALVEPKLPTLVNQELCAGADYETFNATITNAAACEGTVSYKWYETTDTENPVAETAEFTPDADGTYYIVVKHAAAGHATRVAQSANLTVAHFAAPALESYSEDVFQHMGTEATLSVTATGSGLAYAWYTCDAEGNNAVAVDPAVNAASMHIASVAEGVRYYKVAISNTCDATTLSHIFKVEGWDQLEQVDVTATTTWDMTNVSASEINLASFEPSKQNDRLLLANIEGVNNNASFNSQALYFEGQRIGRTENNVKYVSGQYVQFNVTVPGMVSVTFASNGDAQRTIQINGKECSRTTTSSSYIRYDVAVEPGSVKIEDVQGYVRISKIEFKAEDNYHRTVNPAYLGTLCWTNDAILGGAKLYEFQGRDAHNYLVFDEVLENRLEAGKPYIFMPEDGNTEIKVYNIDDAAALTTDQAPVNNMYGTLTGTTLSHNNEHMYYFSSNHIWRVADFTVDVEIPAYYCYVDYLAVLEGPLAPVNPAPGRRRVTMGVQGSQIATGMGEIEASETPMKVMIDGQLFIIRGEKMFDATGRLVK